MNRLPLKNERDAFDEAVSTNLADDNEEALGELSLSGTHEQSVPFLRVASQFGTKVVQFAVKPVIDYNTRKISKKVLDAMAGDPDPGKTLADIRTLLVGPTRTLHDAMFEEVIDIEKSTARCRARCNPWKTTITGFPISPMNWFPLRWKPRCRTASRLKRFRRNCKIRRRPAGNAERDVHGHRRENRGFDRQD